jgi:site-specific recombinase XerD
MLPIPDPSSNEADKGLWHRGRPWLIVSLAVLATLTLLALALGRTWTGDLLEAGVYLATVQKMAGHASLSTTGKYYRRDRTVQRKASASVHVPYFMPMD